MRARNVGFVAAALALVWVGFVAPAHAALDVDFGRYHALVIGINDYKNLPRLETAVNDATAVADVLRQRYGFEVTLLLNPGRSEVIRAMDKLRGELTERDNLLIYYAGHGVLDVEADAGFWMSVDAEEGTRADWIDIGAVTQTVRAMSAKHVMIVSDSCYSGRLTRGLSVSVKTGSEREAELRRLAGKRSRTALVSGGLEPVNDGGGEGHSVFTRAFLTALRESTEVLDGQQLFTAVRRPVIVNADQTPEYSDIRLAGHDGGDFLFVPVSLGAVAPASSAARGEVTREGLGLAFWESIRESRDLADFEAYLSQFPNGTFAALARNRLKELEGTDSAALVAPPAADFELDTLDQDYVALKNANVRAGPSTDTQKLATLPAGSTVTVTGRVRGAEWVRVALPDGGVGYVWDQLLGQQEPEAELASAPAVEPEAEPAPEERPAQTVWEIVLDSGITLGDWLLLAEERLESGEYVALVVEADRYRRQYGSFADVDEVLHAAILGDVRGRSGMARVERAATYGERFGAVAGLAQELDAAVGAVLSEVRVRDAATARLALEQLASLERVAGATVTQLALAAKAHHVLEDFGAAEEVYKRWLREAPTDHPDRKRMALGLFQAQKLESLGPQPGSVFRDCDICPEMVVIPAGEYVMGSPRSEDERYSDEGPPHKVRIDQPFALGIYEVTFAEWDTCVADSGCGGYRSRDAGLGGEQRPVTSVNWKDAEAYIDWLSGRTGKGYRLPSESEWEYAARAGTATTRYWGDDADRACNHANVYDRTSKSENEFRFVHHDCDDGYAQTAPAGSFAANAFGLHDMLGNVREWTEDCSNNTYSGAPGDGSAWRSGDCDLRVLRGGSWNELPRLVRSANRDKRESESRRVDIGFRVARTLD